MFEKEKKQVLDQKMQSGVSVRRKHQYVRGGRPVSGDAVGNDL